MESKTARTLLDCLTAPPGNTAYLMEAHNALSAKVVERAGFEGIWLSGLASSSTLGMRDSSEVTSTQLCSILDTMSDCVELPILVDGDSGFGTFNQARRFARLAEKYGAHGVCIEDKLFPKINSFVDAEHDLTPVSDFCGKIRAVRDTVHSDDFCVVARTETLISGLPVSVALNRARAYMDAGATSIFIHSKRSDISEIAEFCEQWNGYGPLIVAPTTYHRTPVEVYATLGISSVIWANHNIRAATAAMMSVCQRIAETRRITDVEAMLCSVEDLFELSDMQELKAAEQLYS